MSTLQDTPPEPHGIRARRRTVLALSALITIGLALLILTPTGHRTSAPTTGSTAHEAALAAQPPAPAGCFRDPATHAFTCYHAAPTPTATAEPAGYFRDPATHQLLGKPTGHKRGRRRPSHPSSGGVAP